MDALWREHYGAWDAGNLETHMVLRPRSVFVHRSHPVVGLLRYNQEALGVDVDGAIDATGYLMLDRELFEECCCRIRKHVPLQSIREVQEAIEETPLQAEESHEARKRVF